MRLVSHSLELDAASKPFLIVMLCTHASNRYVNACTSISAVLSVVLFARAGTYVHP